ncbi:MAG: FAD-binding oxidoreductase, partial [Pseudomonadota bacterium]
VTVLEGETVGRHASSASAGGVRSLNRHPAEIPLARAALPLWRKAATELGSDVGFQGGGQIRVAIDAPGLEALEARAALTQALGYRHETMIGTNALRAREPHISPECRGALTVEDDGFADPLKSIHALLGAATAAGVVVREHSPVIGLSGSNPIAVQTAEGEIAAEFVVNAAGAWGNTLAAMVGEAIPMRAEGLQMSVTEPMPAFVNAVLGISGHKLSLKQTPSGHVVIGGGFFGRMDESGTLARPIPTNVAKNLSNAARLFPELAHSRVVRSWAGIEGMTEDGLPVVAPSNTMPGLIHAFAFCGHGFALAPLIGRLVAGMMSGQDAPVPLTPFAVDRFHDRAEERLHA